MLPIRKSFGGTVPPNRKLFGGTVPPNKNLEVSNQLTSANCFANIFIKKERGIRKFI